MPKNRSSVKMVLVIVICALEKTNKCKQKQANKNKGMQRISNQFAFK